MTQALALAEENMKDNANTDGLLAQAEKHAEIIVQGLLQGGGRRSDDQNNAQ